VGDVARLSPLVFDHINLLGAMVFPSRNPLLEANYVSSGIPPMQSKMLRDSLYRFSAPSLPSTELN
jgi:hypothetical protein